MTESGDQRREITLADGKQYIIGDAVAELSEIRNADVICLDDAWARPYRGGQFGVEYPTHPFDDGVNEGAETTSTKHIVDACMSALRDGGWLIADADDWLLPRLLDHLITTYGDVNESYNGGGYRKVGGVTYTTLGDGVKPDRSTPGVYGSTGGYPVVFAHRGEADRRWSESVRQITSRQRENFGWGSVKPLAPYRAWLSDLMEPGDHLIVPCAGTAPAAIAAELEFGTAIDYTCIDTKLEAYKAFTRRVDGLNQSLSEDFHAPDV